jgi:hypothetical protein
MLYDFYPQGAMISALVPEVSYKGEDHGFFTLCMLAGIIPRIETRTRLIHIGRKAYPYFGITGVKSGWCPTCGGRGGGHKPGCEDGSEPL